MFIFFIILPVSRYGTQVLVYLSYDKTARLEKPNPLVVRHMITPLLITIALQCTVFPTVTSCSFHSVGSAAGEQKFNSVCILSLNIINEKVGLMSCHKANHSLSIELPQ